MHASMERFGKVDNEGVRFMTTGKKFKRNEPQDKGKNIMYSSFSKPFILDRYHVD